MGRFQSVAEPVFLLDSNICIYILDGAVAPLRQRVEERLPGEIALSAISHAEVMRGIPIEDRERTRRAERLFAYLPVVPFDLPASAAYRAVPFKRGSFDRLIAAQALSLGLTLVTNNERDFDDIPNLKIENWTR